MTQGQYWKIDSAGQADRIIEHLKGWVQTWDYSVPLILKPEAYKNPRSISQNALMHIWFREIAEGLNRAGLTIDGDPYTMDDAKLLMKWMHLGTEDIVKGKLVIKDQLRSTSKLNKGEAQHFMDQILEWASAKNITLSNPAGNEYAKLKEAQRA